MRLNLSRDQIRHLRSLGVRSYKEIIHDQPTEWLQKNFWSGATKFPVNVTSLVRNLCWQMYERIAADEREPFRELIRTYWYSHVKPTITRAESLSADHDQYNVLTNQLSLLTRDEKLFRYSDIGFRDTKAASRQAGTNAHVIIFAEKEGHASFLQELNALYGVSTIALGGQPSTLNSEYFVDDIRKTGVNLQRSFYLFSLVDFDPGGWIIRDSFVNNLAAYGIKTVKVVDLVHPDMLKPHEIKHSKVPVSDHPRISKKNTNWLRSIQQKNYENYEYLQIVRGKQPRDIFGLEAEAVTGKRMMNILEKKIPPLLGRSDQELIIEQFQSLGKNLESLILQKLTG